MKDHHFFADPIARFVGSGDVPNFDDHLSVKWNQNRCLRSFSWLVIMALARTR